MREFKKKIERLKNEFNYLHNDETKSTKNKIWYKILNVIAYYLKVHFSYPVVLTYTYCTNIP